MENVHTRWETIKGQLPTDPDQLAAAQLGMITFTKGYILALEDVIKDLGEHADLAGTSVDEFDKGESFAIGRTHDKVTRSLQEAKETLAHLTSLGTEEGT